MIKPVNWVLGKAQQQSIQQNSLKLIKVQGEQANNITGSLSMKSINTKKRQEQYVPKQPKKQQKIASIFLRNIIRENLRKPFQRMLSRLVIKKTAYKLLTSKKRRDLQFAILAIKSYKIKTQHSSIIKFFEKHTEIRILSSIIKKKQRQNLQYFFNFLKNLSIRASKITLFLSALDESIQRCIKRIYCAHFFNKLRVIDVLRYEHQQKAVDIGKIDTLRTFNIKHEAFNKIVDFILLRQCQNTSQIRINKHQEFTSMNVSKKQQAAQIRQELKALKTNIDQQKLNKNKVFQQKKKVNSSNKVVMTEAVKKFQKQFKEQESITKDIQQIYNIRERVLNVRNRLKQNSKGSQQLCLNLIKWIGLCGQRVKNLSQFLPDIDAQLSKFKQSQVYLLKTNTLLQKLIQLYEKRQAYNYESEFYQLDYENNVVKAMISCFIREQQYDTINHLKKSESQQKKYQ